MAGSQLENETAPCAEVRRVVYEFLDEELPSTDAARVSGHLERCPPCAAFFRFERTYLRTLKRRATTESCPARLRERIRAALAARQRSGPAS